VIKKEYCSGRGTNVHQFSLVNCGLPTNRENYGHTISSGGHFGHKDVAINMVTQDDKRTAVDTENFYSTYIEKMLSMLLTWSREDALLPIPRRKGAKKWTLVIFFFE
jgi:hypothetical protein